MSSLHVGSGQQDDLGAFEGLSKMGDPNLEGAVQFDANERTYRVTGGGEDIWWEVDSFYYVWRKIEGDVSLTTDVAWVGAGKSEFRKGGWMVRGGLEADAPYADAMVHGNGLISLQYRRVAGGPTLEVQAPIRAPATMRLERDGHLFTLSLARNGAPFQPVGTVVVELTGTVYAGLAVCACDASTQETAVLVVIPLFGLMRAFGLMDTHLSLIIAYGTFTLPFVTWMLKGYFDTIPVALEEAAVMDGCSRIQVLFRIVLPLCAPGLVAVALFAFVLAWQDYLFALALTRSQGMRTLTVGLALMQGQQGGVNWGQIMAGSFIACIPAIMIFTFLQKYMIQGFTQGAVKE